MQKQGFVIPIMEKSVGIAFGIGHSQPLQWYPKSLSSCLALLFSVGFISRQTCSKQEETATSCSNFMSPSRKKKPFPWLLQLSPATDEHGFWWAWLRSPFLTICLLSHWAKGGTSCWGSWVLYPFCGLSNTQSTQSEGKMEDPNRYLLHTCTIPSLNIGCYVRCLLWTEGGVNTSYFKPQVIPVLNV